jgi:hypothetical protein
MEILCLYIWDTEWRGMQYKFNFAPCLSSKNLNWMKLKLNILMSSEKWFTAQKLDEIQIFIKVFHSLMELST